MDWNSVKFDWNRAKAFLVTVEEGTLTSAAKALGVSQSTLGRQVSGLESEIGVVLFEKVGKGMVLTPTGEELFQYVKKMGEAAGELSLAASGKIEVIEGSVSITATETVSVHILPPILKRLRKAFPEIRIELIASNTSSDLRKREADIAIRNYRPRHSDLIARNLKTMYASLYASTNYLDELGRPCSLEVLKKANYFGFVESLQIIEGIRGMGLNLTRDNFGLITENHLVHIEMIKLGEGIGIVPNVIGENIAGIEKVLASDKVLPFETWLVCHRELKTNKRIRLVYDFIYDELANLN